MAPRASGLSPPHPESLTLALLSIRVGGQQEFCPPWTERSTLPSVPLWGRLTSSGLGPLPPTFLE